jgi:hypothetical protein
MMVKKWKKLHVIFVGFGHGELAMCKKIPMFIICKSIKFVGI